MFDEVQVVRSVSRSDTRTAGYETCLRNEKSERVCFFFFFWERSLWEFCLHTLIFTRSEVEGVTDG